MKFFKKCAIVCISIAVVNAFIPHQWSNQYILLWSIAAVVSCIMAKRKGEQ